MKINLTPKTIERMASEMCSDFNYYAKTDIVTLTENVIFRTFKNNVFLSGNTMPLTLDDFYDTMDGYKYLQHVYQTLAYHHYLLNKGVSHPNTYYHCNKIFYKIKEDNNEWN